MPTTSSRLALLAPVGADFPSEYRVAATASNAILDNAALYLPPGLLSVRPTSPPEGSFYYATDSELLYLYSGGEWGTVTVAGPWVALSLLNGWAVVGGTHVPAYRLNGDTVQLRGGLNSGPATSSVIATLPVAVSPAAAVYIPVAAGGSSAVLPSVNIGTSGNLAYTAGTGVGDMFLDGASYQLS
jgi:hypothetical protein